MRAGLCASPAIPSCFFSLGSSAIAMSGARLDSRFRTAQCVRKSSICSIFEHIAIQVKRKGALMNKIVLPPDTANSAPWPEGLTRVPYWVFQDQSVYAEEQRKIFRGPNWHYLALEVELAEPGDFLTTNIGDTPVIVTRDTDNEIYAFENRCAHRGALICLENRGKHRKDFSCVYRGSTYDPQCNITG